jgi:hypothetical protein
MYYSDVTRVSLQRDWLVQYLLSYQVACADVYHLQSSALLLSVGARWILHRTR